MPFNFPAVSDHSWARPSPAFIKASGYLGVMRYIGQNYGPGQRDLSLAEMQSYHAEGLKVGFICEGDAHTVRGGEQAGRQMARMANDRLAALGVPRTIQVVSTAVDYQAPRGDLLGPIADFHRGFEDECAWNGVPYGNDEALNVLVGEMHLAPCGWQTRAWSGGRTSVHACMMQEVGYVLANTSDHNSIYQLDETERLVWHPDEKPGTEPTPEPEEDTDMARTYLLTSTRGNQKWLTKRHAGNPSAGEVAGLVNADLQPIDNDGNLLPDGWNSVWAGLAVFEQIEGSPFIRCIDQENVDFLKACAYAQAVSGQTVTITDLGFQEDKLFSGKTCIPRTGLR